MRGTDRKDNAMSFTVYNLVYLIVCIAEALIAYQYFESIREYEGSIKIQAGAYLLCYGILYFSIFFTESFWIGLIVFVILNFFLGFFLYEISWQNAALYSGIMTALFLLAQWMMQGIMESMIIMTGGNRRTLGYIVLSTVFSRLLYLIFMEIVIWLRRRNNNGKALERSSGFVALCTASAATCWGVIVLAYVEMEQMVTGALEWLVISGSLAMILANVIIYWNSIQGRRHYKEYMAVQMQLERENASVVYYRMLAERNEEQKILIHDMRKHLNLMNGLLHMKDYAGVSEYVKELLETPALQPAVRVCDNEMASLILTQYKERCREKGVRFYPDVRSRSLDFLSMKDLTALLANLLDNALEAAAGVPDGFIELKIGRRTRTQVLIRMDNSCIRPPRQTRTGAFVTHKQDAEWHGFGMKSIEKILKKYNGTMETRYDAAKKTFHTMIFMSVQDTDGSEESQMFYADSE